MPTSKQIRAMEGIEVPLAELGDREQKKKVEGSPLIVAVLLGTRKDEE